MTMRRTLALVVATSFALGGSVLTAGAAEARRNVGGTEPAGATCYVPGQAQARSSQALSVLDCFCYTVPAPVPEPKPGERNVGGLLNLITNCPPGILKQHGIVG